MGLRLFGVGGSSTEIVSVSCWGRRVSWSWGWGGVSRSVSWRSRFLEALAYRRRSVYVKRSSSSGSSSLSFCFLCVGGSGFGLESVGLCLRLASVEWTLACGFWLVPEVARCCVRVMVPGGIWVHFGIDRLEGSGWGVKAGTGVVLAAWSCRGFDCFHFSCSVFLVWDLLARAASFFRRRSSRVFFLSALLHKWLIVGCFSFLGSGII